MNVTLRQRWTLLLAVGLLLFMVECRAVPAQQTEAPTATPTPTLAATQPVASPTPTPTPTPVRVVPGTPVPTDNPCAGLGGAIEVQVLVGPAEAVGLNPVVVGEIPFSVTTSQAPYTVQGKSHLSYADVLQKDWGTYEVSLELDAALSGECTPEPNPGQLQVKMEFSGQQTVDVKAQQFQGSYPWSGSHTFDLDFPLLDGATAEGEGWLLMLRLQQQ
jgi:hypothetical protein